MHRDRKWRLALELTDAELQTIGYVTVQWAFLEHALAMRIVEDAEKANVPLPRDATNLSFTRRLSAWRILVEETAANGPERSKTLKLIDQIANLEQYRHQISHGLWGWDERRPERLWAHSFRKPHDFERPTDLSKLKELGKRIAEINFDLTCPNGLLDAEPIPLPNRFQLLGLLKTVPSTQGLALAKPPKRKRPR